MSRIILNNEQNYIEETETKTNKIIKEIPDQNTKMNTNERNSKLIFPVSEYSSKCHKS